jgi:hypothetical protein
VPRRCRSRSVIGLAFLAVALLPALGRAQTAPAETGDDLLQPSLEGSPNTPPTFAPPGSSSPTNQAPPPGRFSRGPIPSAPPVYGSPTGFGAGDTGFDSSNSRKRLAQTPNSGSAIAPSTSTFDQVPAQPPQVSSRPPVLPPPPPAVIYPARAASRPGATLPPPPDELPISNPPPEVHPLSAANRPGAVLALPAPIDYTASTPPPGLPLPGTLPLGTLPTRTLPFAGVDPYEALGIKAGNFLILPALELSTGYSNNAARVPGGPGSMYYVVAPEVHVRSDWASNSLTADIVSSYTAYGSDAFTPSLNAPFLNAKVDSQLDVTRYTQILLEGRTIVSTYAPGSPNIQAGLSKLPATTTVGGTFGVAEAFGRLGVTLKGTFDRSTYATAQFADGETQNQDYLDFDQYAGILRIAYEIDPGIKPFVEVSEDTRIHDQQFDIYGQDRNSNGASAKLGGDFNLFGSLTGEMAIGYMARDYHDPTLPNISGMTVDGSLIWQVTGLTTAKLTAATAVNESILQGVSGAFSRDIDFEVDHALRTWLIANVQAGYGNDDYAGLPRDDNRFFVAGGLTYKMNRDIWLKGELRQDWLTSSQPGNGNQATSVLLTLRLQR